jgi:hypothetical protein
MNYARKLFGYLSIVLLMGFTSAAMANNDDTYVFTMAPTPPSNVATGTPQTITATIKNTTGFDIIKAFKIPIPAGVTGVVLNSTSPSSFFNKITVTNGPGGLISGSGLQLWPTQTAVLTMTATFPAPTQCPTVYDWTPTSVTGGLLVSNEVFNRNSNSAPKQTASATCALSFAPPPANTLAGAIITGAPFNNPAGFPVKVQLKVNGNPVGSSFDTTQVSIAINSPCTLASGSTTQAPVSGGVATFSNLIAGGGTGCTLTATAPNFTSATSAPTFAITAPTGTLLCGAVFTAGTDPNAPGYAAGKRGLFNKGGNGGSDACPQTVNYSFVNTITDNNRVSLTWDTTATGQPNAAFAYTVNWKVEDVDSSGWPLYRHPKVAWLVDSTGNPLFIAAQACTSQFLPAPYGTAAAIDGMTTSIPVTLAAGVTPPPTPFAIVVESERMLVTATGTNWTVVRGDGMTGRVAHPAGAKVMSTPLPLLTQDAIGSQNAYAALTPAHMCIYDHGWIPKGFRPGSNPGVPQVIWQTSVFDIGDGFMDGGD